MPPKKSPEKCFSLEDKTNACSKYIILLKENDTTWSDWYKGAIALRIGQVQRRCLLSSRGKYKQL